jgi:N6-adenosine-specific RNA methylase IME4
VTDLAARDAEIVAASKAGNPPAAIAKRFKLTRDTVYNVLRVARRIERAGAQAPAAFRSLDIRPPDPQDRSGFAVRIVAAWRESTLAILETGRLIAAAKKALPHGEFEAMVAEDLPFSTATARRLMIIAGDERLSDRAHVHDLPPSWGTLYELTKLDDATFEAKIADGTIRPDMERRDIEQTRKATARAVKEELLGRQISALPNEKFGVILADPPWRFEPYSRETGMDRAADNHYPTLDDIPSMADVSKIAADNCALFLWATVPILPHALLTMMAWGFEYRSHFIWAKDRIGTGYWNRNKHELLLLGVKGNVPAPAMGTQWPSVIEAVVGRHSEKPDVFLELIESYFPTLPKIELNRRGPARPGWSAWGNEVEGSREGEGVTSGLQEQGALPNGGKAHKSDGVEPRPEERSGRVKPYGENRGPVTNQDAPPSRDDPGEIPVFLKRDAA